MAPKTKHSSLAKKRKAVKQLSRPESGMRQLGDWHRRDGEDPVPEVMNKAVERFRLSPQVRAKAKLIISQQND